MRRELDAYLDLVAQVPGDPATRYGPWVVSDVTRHLAATFERFDAMLSQARRGDLSPPFPRELLDETNLRAVREFRGDPDVRLREEGERFLALATDPDEVMPHQLGPLPAGAQLHFGLADLAIHHDDDVAAACGSSYAPPDDVVSTLVASYRRLGFWEEGAAPEWATLVAGRNG